jgi:hypothetical protein
MIDYRNEVLRVPDLRDCLSAAANAGEMSRDAANACIEQLGELGTDYASTGRLTRNTAGMEDVVRGLFGEATTPEAKGMAASWGVAV